MGPKTPTIDAEKPMHVRIHDEDRAGATCQDPQNCVLARAILRRRGVIDVHVGVTRVVVLTKRGWVKYALSPKETAQIKHFDLVGQAMPPNYPITLVPPPVKIGARRGEKAGSDKRSGKRTSPNTRRPSTRFIWGAAS